MDPSLILAAIKAGFEFGTECLRFAQTEQGEQFVAGTLSDKAKLDAFFAGVGDGLKKLVTGKLFE